MSLIYHGYDSNNLPVDELVAGAYAEHVGTLGGDEALSTLSRNWVENRVVTQRILDDEDAYLTKITAADTYTTKTYIQSLYPIGTIYMNDTATSVPFDFGTWSLVDGKFLYGCSSDFSDIGDTGGATTVTLANANLPTDSISITIPSLSGSTDIADLSHTHSGTTSTVDLNHYHTGTTGSTNTDHTHSGTTNDGGVNNTGVCQVNQTGLTLGNIAWLNGTTYGYSHSHSFTTGGMSANASHTHPFTTSWASDHTNSNQNHSHSFTTGAMSANSTHSHTVTTTASSTSVVLGSGTAFSILPPYKKVGIWHRTA